MTPLRGAIWNNLADRLMWAHEIFALMKKRIENFSYSSIQVGGCLMRMANEGLIDRVKNGENSVYRLPQPVKL